MKFNIIFNKKNILLLAIILLNNFYNILSLSQIRAEVKYPKISHGYLVSQLEDQGRKFDELKLISNGFIYEFRFISNNIYELVDLFLTTKDFEAIKESIISQAAKLVSEYNSLYQKYLYPVAQELHVSSGKQIKNLNDNEIALKKDILPKFIDELSDLIGNNKAFINETKSKIDALDSKPAPAEILRYKESIELLKSLDMLLEKLVNKLEKGKEQLQANNK